uniref:Uncharacterized protein n=1 Tax=Anopheles quadriannulatus TaxID=34691 RepID=A0A182XRP0_ANOQN
MPRVCVCIIAPRSVQRFFPIPKSVNLFFFSSFCFKHEKEPGEGSILLFALSVRAAVGWFALVYFSNNSSGLLIQPRSASCILITYFNFA